MKMLAKDEDYPQQTRTWETNLATHYYSDLSDYDYWDFPDDGKTRLNIGWLGETENFPRGIVSEETLTELAASATKYTNLMRGYHYCAFCTAAGNNATVTARNSPQEYFSPSLNEKISLGMSEIHVTSDDVVYCAPSMILHYISEHGYLPPQEFLNAALANAAGK